MIKKVSHIEDYKLKVEFTNGTVKNIDLFNFISNSPHHLIHKYLDIDLFKRFYVDYTVCWGDNDFDINPQKIYQGVYDIV